MIRLEGIAKEYDSRMILHNLSCEFSDNRISAIIAPNGEGKTTLLNIIGGITEPDHGKVTQEGHSHHTDVDMIQAGDKNLYSKNTVRENLYYFCAIRGMNARQTESAIEEWKHDFPLYESIKSVTVEKLSYGQKRLVALFSSILSGASCLLLDEVTEGLDRNHVDSVKQILLKSKTGRTIIIASHDDKFVAEIADDFYFLQEGKLRQHPQSEMARIL
ncbi:MAG: ABC transporter ATP-binding protein [Lachnospiraceae bacterium]|nr:ABC transporter ATP-binding protein [Lachnospiraceae bacterium]